MEFSNSITKIINKQYPNFRGKKVGEIMKFVELLKIIGTALGGITGICATIVAIFKPLRKGFVNWVVCNTGSANMAKQISEIEKMMKDHIGQDAQKA